MEMTCPAYFFNVVFHISTGIEKTNTDLIQVTL